MIRIISKQDGFYRCGVRHPAAPTDYQGNRFSAQELARLKSEPMLIVQEVPDAPAPKEDPVARSVVEEVQADSVAGVDQKAADSGPKGKKGK